MFPPALAVGGGVVGIVICACSHTPLVAIAATHNAARCLAPPTEDGSGGGDEGMGKRVQQRGSPHRSEEASAGERTSGLSAEEMDSRADAGVVGSEQEDEQRLREAAGDRRSLHLRGDESPDGQAFGSLMRLFRQFLNGVLRSSSAGLPYQASTRSQSPPTT